MSLLDIDVEQNMSIKQPERDSVPSHIITLAGYLVRYYRHSLRVRGAPLLRSTDFDPPIVRELINFLLWQGQFNILDTTKQAVSLNEIVNYSVHEMEELIASRTDTGYSEEQLKRFVELEEQIESAHSMLKQVAHGK